MNGLIHVGAWDGREYVGVERPLILFEPQAEAFAALRANLAGHENATLVNAAVGAQIGTATMYSASPSHSSSLLGPCVAERTTREMRITFGGTEEVAVTTLDRELRDRDGFDTLRIDTQGYELEVLKGATDALKQIKRIELELHDPSTYPGAAQLPELDAFLARQGFTRTGLDVEHSDDLGDAVYER